jgi:hypothetical protein
MSKAIAAYAPNIPWPQYGCRTRIWLNGEGTSAATPQVAAAAGLWSENYKQRHPRTWRQRLPVNRRLQQLVPLQSGHVSSSIGSSVRS